MEGGHLMRLLLGAFAIPIAYVAGFYTGAGALSSSDFLYWASVVVCAMLYIESHKKVAGSGKK